MNLSKIKLSHQIKKIVQKRNLQAYDNEALGLVTQELKENYNEHDNETEEWLKLMIPEILLSVISTVSLPPGGNGSTVTTSLNKHISNSQILSGTKRQRPEEDNNDDKKNVDSTKETVSVRDKRKKITPIETLSGSSKKHTLKTAPFLVERPTLKFSDLAGLEPTIQQIRELVCYPLQYPELYSRLGVSPPCGILLHGPSGCGKTTLANAIAGETGLPYFKVKHCKIS